MINRGLRRIIETEVNEGPTMARRARKPLLPQIIWGPKNQNYRHDARVVVVRIPSQLSVQAKLREDAVLASVLGVMLTAIVALVA